VYRKEHVLFFLQRRSIPPELTRGWRDRFEEKSSFM